MITYAKRKITHIFKVWSKSLT